MRFTERLFRRLLLQIPILVEFLEDSLRDFGVLRCRGTAKVIEANFKPVVDFLVDLVVFGTQLLRAYFLLKGLGLRRSSIFIGSTDEESRSSTSLMVSVQRGRKITLISSVRMIVEDQSLPREDIGTQHGTDDVAQMRHIVDIGQRTRDKNVALTLLWQNLGI